MKRFIKRTILLPFLCLLYGVDSGKMAEELRFWKRWLRTGGEPGLDVEGHAAIVETMCGGSPEGRVVLDFGCGPVCALAALAGKNTVVGADVLAGKYKKMLERKGLSAGYDFVVTTEKSVPLPDESADIVFTANALDHCRYPFAMLRELQRCLKPGGAFVGVFNIGEPPTLTEPSTLREETLLGQLTELFQNLQVLRSKRGAQGSFYEFFHRKEFLDAPPGEGEYVLYVSGSSRKALPKDEPGETNKYKSR